VTFVARCMSFLRGLFFARRQDREMDEEWRFHVDARIEALVASGRTRTEAQRLAHREFGDPLRWKEQGREARGFRWIQDLDSDLRHALRQLRHTPAFAVVTISTLGLVIGANTALFSVVNGLLLRPLPVAEPERLAMLSSASAVAQRSQATWPRPIWRQLEEDGLVENVLAWSGIDRGAQRRFDLGEGGEAQPADGLFVSGGFFDALGVRAARGRVLRASDDDRAQDALVGVISHDLWQRRFASADDIVGRTIHVERIPVAIVGVLPPGFFGVDVGRSFDIALPFAAGPAVLRAPDDWIEQASASVMLRLKPGQSPATATQLLRGVQARLAAGSLPADCAICERFLTDPFTVVSAGVGVSELRAQYQQPLITVLIIAALVLLVACVNIANLVHARGLARWHEMSVRTAIGAPRWRLVRVMLIESALLAGAGAVAGLVLAMWLSRSLIGHLATINTRVVLDLPLDWRVLVFAIALTGATTALFGMLPALRTTRVASALTLRRVASVQPDGATSRRAWRVRPGDGGVILQVALSLVLIAAAALFLRTFERLVTRPLGFDSDRVLVVQVNAARSQIQPAARLALYERLVEAVAALPGVERAAASRITPVSVTSMDASIVDAPDDPESPFQDRLVPTNHVTPGWFAAYDSPFLAGRDIDVRDAYGAPPVAVVNQAFVERFVRAPDPIGHLITFDADLQPSATPRTIVGVVGNSVLVSPAEDRSAPLLYQPLAQCCETLPDRIEISVRSTAGSPALLARSIAAALTAIEPGLSFTFRPLAAQVDAALARNRLLASLSGFFGLLAMLLAGIGLYGVTAYRVSQRRPEIGIRMALGAGRRAIVRLVLSRAIWLVLTGVIIGTVASAILSGLIDGLLYGVTPRDPATLASAVLILITVATVAASLPARRASRIDPWTVLRDQ
jgi:putative ABC transport system permease protein